jgi:hypothetical protein
MSCIVTNAAFAAPPPFPKYFYDDILDHIDQMAVSFDEDDDSALVNDMNALTVAHDDEYDDAEYDNAIRIEPKWHQSLTAARWALGGEYPPKRVLSTLTKPIPTLSRFASRRCALAASS